MSNAHKHRWLPSLLLAFAAYTLPRIAWASVGAGAGLPYEDTFSKVITSLTGPWAWSVAVLAALMFCWRAVERGGDLGGSTLGFLGPAFICTMLLGVKKLMSFFGQGALLTTPASLIVIGATFALGIITGVLALAPVTLQLYRCYKRQALLQAQPQAFEAQVTTDVGHTLVIGSTRTGMSRLPIEVPPPSASDLRPWPRPEVSKEN